MRPPRSLRPPTKLCKSDGRRANVTGVAVPAAAGFADTQRAVSRAWRVARRAQEKLRTLSVWVVPGMPSS